MTDRGTEVRTVSPEELTEEFLSEFRRRQIVLPGFVDTKKDRSMEPVLPGFKRERQF